VLSGEHACHEDAQWFGNRKNQSQKNEYLKPAIDGHFKISPAATARRTGTP
jgi:hypothetical protein